MMDPRQMETLNATLRGAATRAGALAGGGCALLFAGMPGERDATSQLRAAAGFESPDAARAAAQELMDEVSEVLDTGQASSGAGHAALGTAGAGALTILPLGGESGVLGALLVGHPQPPSEAVSQQLAQLAGSAAIHLDYGHLRNEIHGMRKKLVETEAVAEEKSDELLKLSEALFAQDIELLRSNEKLGKIEKLKNDFIEKMSRELRTPLNSIIEAVIAVLTGEHDSLSETAKESLRSALDEGTVFQRTLENILDLWRIKQGELPIEIQEVSFPELVEEAIFSIQDTLEGKPIEIEKDIQPFLPKFRADLAKVNQILFLLLDNAAKFTEEGRIVIRAKLNGDELECEVDDTGIGICADDQQFIFDDFFQVDERTSTRYRGAGLGLTLVRDLLLLLDGEVQMDSEAGKGTRITFRIPVETPPS